MPRSFSAIAIAATCFLCVTPSLAQLPIRIGTLIAVSGRDNVQGGYVRDGYLLCQKQVNEKGGVLGRPIGLVIRDDGSNPKKAVDLYEKLSARDKIALEGTVASPVSRSSALFWYE